MPMAVCSGDRGRREMAEFGGTELPSPADFCAIFSNLAKHHPTTGAPCQRLLFLYPANSAGKGAGLFRLHT